MKQAIHYLFLLSYCTKPFHSNVHNSKPRGRRNVTIVFMDSQPNTKSNTDSVHFNCKGLEPVHRWRQWPLPLPQIVCPVYKLALNLQPFLPLLHVPLSTTISFNDCINYQRRIIKTTTTTTASLAHEAVQAENTQQLPEQINFPKTTFPGDPYIIHLIGRTPLAVPGSSDCRGILPWKMVDDFRLGF